MTISKNKKGYIRYFCSLCGKIMRRKEGYYFQFFKRDNYSNRENGFCCNKCLGKIEGLCLTP